MGTNHENEFNQSTETAKEKIDQKGSSAVNLATKTGTNIKKNHTSMSSLIIWNVSKALERKPYMDLKSGMNTAQERIQRVSREGNTTISQYPEEEHLVCALLAWQQLGHAHADSLYNFIMSKKIGDANNTNNPNDEKQLKTLIVTSDSINIHCEESRSSKDVDASSFGGYSNGAVIKLPVETKIIMRMEQTGEKKKCQRCKRQGSKESKVSTNSQESTGSTKSTSQSNPAKKDCQHCGPQGSQESTDTTNKINAACCMESMCSEKLTKMDADTAELRSRAERLAKREAQRSELLERAENAWKDLERGYQRRLTLAQEKEEDITRQIQKIIDDRNNYKKACNTLAQDLKGKGDIAEEARSLLKNVEVEVCQYACQRLKLSEEATRAEAALAEQQCKTVQLQRDLQFKEEQVRRKVMTMESETESACALTHETERALRAELSGLREQINQVSKQLLEEDVVNKRLKNELDTLRKEKLDMIEDLEGCKLQCDGKIKAQMDEVQAKRQKLQELKDIELECRCKLPIDAAVEVKRTPSLAALCKCSPEDRIMDSCSCTSMKGRLLSNLLADLFGGLQSELGGTGSQMPCQLLKCLEDQHNWDRASVTKSNLRNYFSKLLVGELDIAIATSIENYHAKWVGISCADNNIKMTPGPGDDLNEGWEKRAIERRAQKLAAQLAEELYEKRADELTKRAKSIVTSGPPPCECNKRGGSHHVYPCILEPVTPFHTKLPEVTRKGSQFDKGISPPPPAYWKRTHHDVTQLRLEIEDLKKESIKKEDLKLMEEKITQIVQKTAGPDSEDVVYRDNANNQSKYKKETKCARNTNTDDLLKNTTYNKTGVNKKKSFDLNSSPKKTFLHEKPTKQPKKYSYHQTYAVNMCLCATQKTNKNLPNNRSNFDVKTFAKQKSPQEIQSLTYNVQQTKLMNHSSSDNDRMHNKVSLESHCGKDCKCFHKLPSNTSIDKLLETLTKWKSDLGEGSSEDKIIKNDNETNISKTCLSKHSKSILKNRSKIDSKAIHLVENGKEVSEDQKFKKSFEVEKQNHSINFNEVVKTPSEYIAAVNLDKSIENARNFADTKEPYKENKQLKINTIDDQRDPFDHINPTKHKDQHPLIPRETLQPNPKDAKMVLTQHLHSKLNNTPNLHILTNSKNTRAINTEENKKEPELARLGLVQNQPKLLHNLDYYVKFLGVTLVDKKSNKVVKESVNNCHDTSLLCKESTKTFHKEVAKSRTPKSSSDSSKNLAAEVVINSSKQKKCECKAKFEELKHFIIGLLNEHVKNKNTGHKDIALDSQNLTRPIDPFGSCICCSTKNVDCSNDLEVNAFDLLEAHLKEKIKEFKICSCQSSCISAEDEEKIYRTILKRVKQVISDCANELKCSETEKLLGTIEGSWHRAHGLLREYLKMKVKRAQCLPLLSEDKDEVLPDILDKVCNLIENDFQRLKDMCKCEKKEKLVTKITFMEPLSKPDKELPEKDIDISASKNHTTTFKTMPHQILTRPAIFKQNISSQVLSDVEMDTKSCDAMVKNINIASAVSTQDLIKPLTQSLSSQVPLDLGMATKSCHAIPYVKNKVKTVSKENLTEFTHLTPHLDVCSQVPIVLGMETKSCDAMIKADNIVKIVSRVNIPNTNNLSQHMASQVPLNLGMESKCCNAVNNIIENATELEFLTPNKLSHKSYHPKMTTRSSDVPDTETPPELIYNTCNCNYSHKKCGHRDFESKTVFFNLHTDLLKSCNVNNSNNFKKHTDWIHANVLENTKSLPNLEAIRNTKALFNLEDMENNTNDMNNDTKIIHNYGPSNDIPYVGTTIDCICDSSFKSCTCTKSLIQDSSYKLGHDWKQILADSHRSTKNFSYIMNGNHNKHNDKMLCEMLYNISVFNERDSDNNTCESEDILLLHSKKTFGAKQNSTNSSDKNTKLITDSNCNGQFDWFMCPQPVKSQTKTVPVRLSNSSFCYDPVDESISSDKSVTITELIPSTDKITDSLYYEPIIASKCSRKSLTTLDMATDSIKLSHDCNCDKVPLCHVKMLVENIERNLIESKCTCDSVSKICPMHSKTFH